MTREPEARFEREGDWLAVFASGPMRVDWLVEMVGRIAADIRAAPASALLIDTRAMVGGLDDLGRYRLATAAVSAQLAGPIAFLGRNDVLDPKRFGEVVARNRGVNVRVFSDENEARAWLREQTQHPAS